MTVNFRGYQVGEQLYNGSRTLVHRALRESDQKPVALKILKNPYPSFSELLQFRNQYTIAKNLDIAGVVRPYSLETYRNGYALVMEDFGGISLKEYAVLLRETKQSKCEALPIAEFLPIALQIVSILDGLYRDRVIHKDIKPANILINPHTKQVKLIDFSISSLLPRETQTIASPNVLEGTLAYLSPEQTGRMNRGIDYRSDFYSLGVTFFELLTGKLPFSSDEPMELVHCHIAKQPSFANNINADIPPILSQIVAKLMAKNAENRYQSALGLKFDLETCLARWQETGHINDFELGKRDICDRFIIPEKLYGRDEEVKTLLAAFDRVAATAGKAEMILVAGFSGIGKTAIVNEVHKPIVKQCGYFIKGKFDQFNRNIPFSAFVQAFRDLMGQLMTETDLQIQHWREKMLAALGENGQVIIEVIPELERIIGKQPQVQKLSGSASQNRFNLLFQKFISVFTTKEHPLVIFLDDLQWADSASLKLMQLLMSETDSSYLLLIGAYRDNEVSPVHPLILTLEDIKKTKATVNIIVLETLQSNDLNNLIADTLSCDIELALPLTELVYQKTRGNPFFATQFLKSLYEDKLITFNQESGYWQCDIAQVKALSLTDDVVEFMALQLQKLPGKTQDVLKLAACIGNCFDLATLGIVYEKSQVETAADLWKALQEGLLIPTSEVYKFFQDSEDFQPLAITDRQSANYRFLHDRVQQAAYSLIPNQQKQVTHLKIGQLLLSHTSVTEQEEKLFEIVNQLNMGKSLIVEASEQTQLAQLNLQAGQKARAATAYAAAFEYATTGIDLLAQEGWKTQYELTLALYEAAAEAAYLNGNFPQMTQLTEIVLEHTKTLLERVNVYQVEIQAAQAQSQPSKAIQIALQILQQLGVSFPEQPNEQDIGQALQETLSLLGGRPPLDLISLAQMTDPNQLAIMSILAGVTASAYVAAPTLLPLIMLKQVKLSLQYGNSGFSPDGYCGCGLILCGVVGDIEYGYQFGQLALLLLEQLNTRNLKARTYGQVNCCISHWKEPLRNTLAFFRDGYQSGLETGDLEWGGVCAVLYLMHAWFAGKELSDLSREGAAFCNQFAQLKQETMAKQGAIFQQAILNLLGNSTVAWQFNGNSFSEAENLPMFLQAGNQTAPCYFYVSKLVLCYLFGQIEEAIAAASALESYLGGATAMSLIPVFYTYDSLTHLANYAQVCQVKQQQILQRVTANQEKIERWADAAPANQLHKYHLVEAEKNRVLGHRIEAMDGYDRAIQLAHEHKFINDEALSNELAAKFYLNTGKEKVAAGYMQEAYYCYARWGAKAKTDALEKCYPDLLRPILHQTAQTVNTLETLASLSDAKLFINTSTKTTLSFSTSINTALDFAAILKASQALSGTIQVNELLQQLTQIILKNSGGDRCVLILPNGDGKWQVQAVATTEQTELLSEPLENSFHAPIKLIHYVKNNQEVVAIEDSKTDLPVIGEYLSQHQPKSVLCLPILNQGNLGGILYLENRDTSGVFTSDRIVILNFLCTQAAISLQNARLYQQAQDYAQQLEQSQLQLVQSEKMSALGNLVAGVAHEINNPVWFISGNINEAIASFKALTEFLHLYQEKFPNPGDEIEEKAEDLDIEYLLEDLPKMLGSMQVGCDRIKNISTSLRTFSRADTAEKVEANLHEGLDSTLMILRHRLKANDKRPEIQIVKEYGNIPKVKCYLGQLNQVFMNLLANAIDALDESNQNRSFAEIKNCPNTITIKTEVSTDRQNVVVKIKDNGKGMTEEVKTRIFDHLFTTKRVGKGTGLGLSISRQIVEKTHQGSLTCESVLGEGTEFAIMLRIADAIALPIH